MKKFKNKKLSHSSKLWITRQNNDPLVELAKKQNYRSRAVFKLIEIDKKLKLLKNNLNIIDLGSAPGSWSQYAADIVGQAGHVIALDLLPMTGIQNVSFIQGDFLADSVLQNLEDHLNNRQLDLVISDMAPNISGIKSRDQAMMMNLNELTLAFAKDWLKPKGHFAVKTFIGAGYEDFVVELKKTFTKVINFKPAASRDRSAELFLVGLEKR
jgi:23S rRNA (uridine2552-2'-O)-methyltransferase